LRKPSTVLASASPSASSSRRASRRTLGSWEGSRICDLVLLVIIESQSAPCFVCQINNKIVFELLMRIVIIKRNRLSNVPGQRIGIFGTSVSLVLGRKRKIEKVSIGRLCWRVGQHHVKNHPMNASIIVCVRHICPSTFCSILAEEKRR
jgi:hypothetical protein